GATTWPVWVVARSTDTRRGKSSCYLRRARIGERPLVHPDQVLRGCDRSAAIGNEHLKLQPNNRENVFRKSRSPALLILSWTPPHFEKPARRFSRSTGRATSFRHHRRRKCRGRDKDRD